MAFLTEADRKYTTPEDICAHLGDEYGKFCGAIVPPIFQNSLFVQPTEANGITGAEPVFSIPGRCRHRQALLLQRQGAQPPRHRKSHQGRRL